MSKHCTSQVHHAIHSLSKIIADECNKQGVKEVIVGDLRGMKKNNNMQGKHWNKSSNQKSQQFPIQLLVQLLRYKLARIGIRLINVNEAWTSKGRCSICGCEDLKLINRTKRGEFQCKSCSIIIHADVNGAWNILDKYLHQSNKKLDEGSSGRLARPQMRRWNRHQWLVVS